LVSGFVGSILGLLVAVVEALVAFAELGDVGVQRLLAADADRRSNCIPNVDSAN